MKKAFALLLVCFIIGGCGKQSGGTEVVQTKKETEAADAVVDTKDTETAPEAMTEKETMEEEMDSDIPEHVKQIYLGYKEVQETCDVQYLMEDPAPRKNKFGSYEFYLADKDNPRESESFWFEEYDGETEKTYHMNISLDAGEYFEDIIIATFMVTGGFNYAEAKDQMQKLIQSYPVDNYSDILDSGEYKILLTPLGATGLAFNLEVIQKDEIFKKIDKNQYSDISYDLYQAPYENAGMLVSLTGTVLEHQQKKDLSLIEVLRVLGEDGNEYIVSYLLKYYPVMFEIGKQYTFYGQLETKRTIWDVSISLDACE